VNGDGALDILGAARKANTIAWWENMRGLGRDWAQATASAPWSARRHHTSVVHDGKIWVIGGWDWGFKKDVWCSSDGTSWAQATASAPWSGRLNHSSVVHNGKIWVIGGWDGSPKNDVWYSSDGTSWTQATASAPWSARQEQRSVVHDGKIWVIGGLDNGGFKNDVWYSSDGVDWTSATLSAPWSSREEHKSVVHGGKIWVIGGWDGSSRKNDVWYSSDGVNWTSATLSAPWSPRYGHSSVVHDGKMWVIGGWDGSGLVNDVWYSPDGVSWTQATSSAPWSGRYDPMSVVHDEKIWVLGGYDGSNRNDVWYTPAESAPDTPVNASPEDGATGLSLTPTLESSLYHKPSSTITHAASQWQVREASSSADYSTAVFDSGTDAANLTSITIPAGTLDHATNYAWRVRYQGSNGVWSPWSSETEFTTRPGSFAYEDGIQVSVPGEPYSLTTGDFDDDGHEDFAVVNMLPSPEATVFLGDGAGGFTPSTPSAIPRSPNAARLVAEDFNRDGALDLAYATSAGTPGPHLVSVLLGNGDGTLHAARTFSAPWAPHRLQAGDMNNDGIPDIVVVGVYSKETWILLGKGDGDFLSPITLGTTSGADGLVLADFNDDGNLDAAGSNPFSNDVTVLLGDGTGHLAVRGSFAAGAFPNDIATGDLNGDGKIDLAVAAGNDGAVAILYGDGMGDFSAPQSVSVGPSPPSLAVADLNVDGDQDIAVTSPVDSTVRVLLGDGAGGFEPFQSLACPSAAHVLVSADFNEDGAPDLVASMPAGDAVCVFLSRAAPALFNPGNGHWYTVVTDAKTWGEAKSTAERMVHQSMLGHLATLTSDDERAWVAANVDFQGETHLWLGGYQDPEGAEPDGGWRWVTGEPWVYANWAPGEPNDAYVVEGVDEDCLELDLDRGGQWNDSPAPDTAKAFLVEFEGSPDAIRDLIASFYRQVLGREPEAGAVDAWHHGYFDYAVSFNIDVRFIPREMGRLFFLSEEYRDRQQTNGEFITDCYRVFLNRGPTDSELTAWLVGEWNRSQVMTIFAESEEFANRIDSMYPILKGDPTRNFVTTMYVGLLDRLVDKDGLEFAVGLFDATNARNGVEGVRAAARDMAGGVFMSEEFLGKSPTSEDYVVRLYRAFLGRFPNDAELAYWTAELDSGRRTTDDAISLFADSAEFTERLRMYFETP
jgi:hypothetical protein